MYIPPYKHLFSENADSKGSGKEAVTVSKSVFNLILKIAMTAIDFDEKKYLAANPDVAMGPIRKGEMTGKQHFCAYGYFEGRKGWLPTVDEAWYRQKYQDVDDAISAGKIKSAQEHFESIGVIEGRSPTEKLERVAALWLSND